MRRVALHRHCYGQGRLEDPDPRLIHRKCLPGNAQKLRTETRAKEHRMLDILMLALGLGFFAAGIGYAYTCERL